MPNCLFSNARFMLKLVLTGIFMGALLTPIVYAQVEDPDEPSTTEAEKALTQWPESGDRPFDAKPQRPIQFKRASERTEIGLATHRLLNAQRSAQSAHPRTIDGEQASRSYARYLKSFETEIPEQYSTGIDTGVSN